MTALPCRSALLHVAHFVIDGAVRGAWSWEVELRPWVESF